MKWNKKRQRQNTEKKARILSKMKQSKQECWRMKHTTQWDVFALRNACTHKSNCKHPVRRFNHCKKSNFRSFFRFVSMKAHFLLGIFFVRSVLVFFIFSFSICRDLVAAAAAAAVCLHLCIPGSVWRDVSFLHSRTHLSYGTKKMVCECVFDCTLPLTRESFSLSVFVVFSSLLSVFIGLSLICTADCCLAIFNQ